MMNTTGYFTHKDCRKHEMGPGHPECPERLDTIEDRLLHRVAPTVRGDGLLGLGRFVHDMLPGARTVGVTANGKKDSVTNGVIELLSQ